MNIFRAIILVVMWF